MAEEPRGSEDTTREKATSERSFDDLVKVFASGTVSRRRLLMVMGKALVGSVLVSIPGVASTASAALAQSCEWECTQRGIVKACGRQTFSTGEACASYYGPKCVCEQIGGTNLWRCCRYEEQCVAQQLCCSYHGTCTGSTAIPWRPAPTRCVTSPKGFTNCCTGWNKYPWIRECESGARTYGCGFCIW